MHLGVGALAPTHAAVFSRLQPLRNCPFPPIQRPPDVTPYSGVPSGRHLCTAHPRRGTAMPCPPRRLRASQNVAAGFSRAPLPFSSLNLCSGRGPSRAPLPFSLGGGGLIVEARLQPG